MKVSPEVIYKHYKENKIDLEFAKGIHGQLAVEEGRMLSVLASLIPKGEVIFEIGSYLGRSLSFLTLGANRGECREIISFDRGCPANQKTLNETIANLGKLTQVKNEHVFDAACMAWEEVMKKEPKIGLFFYDAEHSVRAFFTILTMYEYMFADEAIIVCHDAHGIETAPVFRAFQKVLNIRLEPCFYEPSWYGTFGFLGFQYYKNGRFPKGYVKNPKIEDILIRVAHVAKTKFPNDVPDEHEP